MYGEDMHVTIDDQWYMDEHVHEMFMNKLWWGHGWTCSWKNWVHQLRRQAEKSLLWRPVRAHPGPGPKRFRRPRGSRRRMMYPFITCRMQKWKLIRSANLKCFNVEMPIPAVAYCSDVVAMAWFPDGSIVIISTIQHYNHYSCFSVFLLFAQLNYCCPLLLPQKKCVPQPEAFCPSLLKSQSWIQLTWSSETDPGFQLKPGLPSGNLT